MLFRPFKLNVRCILTSSMPAGYSVALSGFGFFKRFSGIDILLMVLLSYVIVSLLQVFCSFQAVKCVAFEVKLYLRIASVFFLS